jgi:hypothetical protein
MFDSLPLWGRMRLRDVVFELRPFRHANSALGSWVSEELLSSQSARGAQFAVMESFERYGLYRSFLDSILYPAVVSREYKIRDLFHESNEYNFNLRKLSSRGKHRLSYYKYKS